LLAQYLVEADPASWRQFRNENRAAYDELCADLDRRQRGLCAFCEIDLLTSVGTNAREIEHWRPKSLDTPPDVRWTFGIDNLQLGCLGGSYRYPTVDQDRTGDPAPGPNRSCGAIKGGRDPAQSINGFMPYRPEDLPEYPAMFTVSDDGTLRPVADCGTFGLDVDRLQTTIDFLGLNCTRLKQARRAIMQSLNAALLDYVDNSGGATVDDRFDAAFEELARDTAPDIEGQLPRFVTTIRSFFGREFESLLFPSSGWSTGG